MQTSRIIEVGGVFIGAAIELPKAQGWRFVAAGGRTSQADGCVAPTLHDARTLALRAFITAQSQTALSALATACVPS